LVAATVLGLGRAEARFPRGFSANEEVEVTSTRMSMSYEHAVEELYRTPLSSFVAQRKRLAGELKAAGEASGAQRLAKAARPTLSAWVVNQLWWTEQKTFERLLKTAKEVRVGDTEALATHRDVLAELRDRAAALLSDEGRGANEAMLRRITTTLGALAASGGFEPDPPGALVADRDPPGFEAALGMLADAPQRAETKARTENPRDHSDADAVDTAAARRRAEAERKRLEAEQRRLEAERTKLNAALEKQRREVTARENDVARLREELAAAERRLADARTKESTITDELRNLEAAGSAT
jgi:hypothetical protein